MAREPEDRDVRRTREEDILHETPDPMDIAARTSGEQVPPITQALLRERYTMGQPITLLDSAELAGGALVVIYRAQYGRRIAVYQRGHPLFSGTLD